MELISSGLDYLKLGFMGGWEDLGTFRTFFESEDHFMEVYESLRERVRVELVSGLDMVSKKTDRALAGYAFCLEAKSDFWVSHNLTELEARANVLRVDVALDFASDGGFFPRFRDYLSRRNWRFNRMRVQVFGNPRDGETFYLGSRQLVCVRVYDKVLDSIRKKKFYWVDYLKSRAPEAQEFVRVEFEFRRAAFRRYGLADNLSVIHQLPGFISARYPVLLDFLGVSSFTLSYGVQGISVSRAHQKVIDFMRGVRMAFNAYRDLEGSGDSSLLFDYADSAVRDLISLAYRLQAQRDFIKGGVV